MSVDELKSLNNLSSNNLTIGQVLKISDNNANQSNVYIVKNGDTLWNIAQKFNTTVDELKRINNLTSNVLSVGQQLIIPTTTTSNEYETYTVKKGDTLWNIAKQFGISSDELKNINNLASNTISVGLVLKVPKNDEFSYTVVSGDTLWSIAQKFNTTVDNLKRINNLTSNVLSLGQKLKIK